jgi:hypothetical protein
MRIPISHSIALSAALCLTVAARAELINHIPAASGASVAEKLRIIRDTVSSLTSIPAHERPTLAQKWRNCISGFWRNC